MRRQEIQIQDGHLFEWLKARKRMCFELITGSVIVGRVHRFDRYCILVAVEGSDDFQLVYKHAVARIGSAAAEARSTAHLAPMDRDRREIARRRPRAAAVQARLAVMGGHR